MELIEAALIPNHLAHSLVKWFYYNKWGQLRRSVSLNRASEVQPEAGGMEIEGQQRFFPLHVKGKCFHNTQLSKWFCLCRGRIKHLKQCEIETPKNISVKFTWVLHRYVSQPQGQASFWVRYSQYSMPRMTSLKYNLACSSDKGLSVGTSITGLWSRHEEQTNTQSKAEHHTSAVSLLAPDFNSQSEDFPGSKQTHRSWSIMTDEEYHCLLGTEIEPYSKIFIYSLLFSLSIWAGKLNLYNNARLVFTNCTISKL